LLLSAAVAVLLLQEKVDRKLVGGFILGFENC
jgi:hypothetical protein